MALPTTPPKNLFITITAKPIADAAKENLPAIEAVITVAELTKLKQLIKSAELELLK